MFLVLAVEIADRPEPQPPGPGPVRRVAEIAERAGFALVTIGDDLLRAGRIGAVERAAFVAASTSVLAVAPVVSTTYTEPFHGTDFDDALAFAEDIRARLRAAGRPEDDLRILPGTSIVVGQTAAEAEEKAAWVRREQLTPATALAQAGLLWNLDLSGYDPDGPLPKDDPRAQDDSGAFGAARVADAQGTIVRLLVPALQERGLYRTAYTGTTLRDHLGLRPRPVA